MKRIILMALLGLALPLTAFAGTVDFTNTGGTLSGNSSGLTLSGSELTDVTGFDGLTLSPGAFGNVAFSTAALASGSVTMGGTFNPGGSILILGNGTGGIPSGSIFDGSFSGTVTWTLHTLASGTDFYELTGSVTGTWFDGSTVGGTTDQITVDTGGFFNGSATLSDGTTIITTGVPEPGTLGLLGTGLLSLAGILGRKLKV